MERDSTTNVTHLSERDGNTSAGALQGLAQTLVESVARTESVCELSGAHELIQTHPFSTGGVFHPPPTGFSALVHPAGLPSDGAMTSRWSLAYGRGLFERGFRVVFLHVSFRFSDENVFQFVKNMT